MVSNYNNVPSPNYDLNKAMQQILRFGGTNPVAGGMPDLSFLENDPAMKETLTMFGNPNEAASALNKLYKEYGFNDYVGTVTAQNIAPAFKTLPSAQNTTTSLQGYPPSSGVSTGGKLGQAVKNANLTLANIKREKEIKELKDFLLENNLSLEDLPEEVTQGLTPKERAQLENLYPPPAQSDEASDLGDEPGQVPGKAAAVAKNNSMAEWAKKKVSLTGQASQAKNAEKQKTDALAELKTSLQSLISEVEDHKAGSIPLFGGMLYPKDGLVSYDELREFHRSLKNKQNKTPEDEKKLLKLAVLMDNFSVAKNKEGYLSADSVIQASTEKA
jgi:hypothetical protein